MSVKPVRKSKPMHQKLFPAHWFRYELWGYICAHTSPLFSVFWFPSSNMRALGKQDCGAPGKQLCYVIQIGRRWIMKVQNLHIQIEVWEKINRYRTKQKIWAPFTAVGHIQPKRIGFGIETDQKEQSLNLGIFCSTVLCSCVSAFQEGVTEVSDATPGKKLHAYQSFLSVSLTTYISVHRNIV